MTTDLALSDLLPSTQAKYDAIVRSVGQDDPIDWLRRRVRATTPIGTVLPLRAAIKRHLMEEHGYEADEMKALLPEAQGRSTAARGAMTAEQLAIYYMAVEEISREPARTILALLPMTGFRIGQLCGLSRDDLDTLILSKAAKRTLTWYLDVIKPGHWLFTGYGNKPITNHAIRLYTRKIAKRYPDLADLTPSTLRHTFAVMALGRGMELQTLQKILGHGSILTTQRYLTGDGLIQG
jgi:integrase